MSSTGHHPWIENAILIYGPRKGGTTLFQNLLDGGDDLFVYPAELKLKFLAHTPELSPTEYFSQSKLPANNPAAMPRTAADGTWDPDAYFRHTREYNVSAEAFDRAGYEAAWKADAETRQPVARLIRLDAIRVFENSRFRHASPRMWCAKEVGGHSGRVLDLWKKIFPQGRLLLITRDPLMVVRSVLHDRRRVNQRPSIWNIIKQTYDPMAVNATVARLATNKDVHVLSYEDLVATPEATMRKVADFLGIAFTAKLTQPTLLGEQVVVRTSSRVEKNIFISDATWTDGLTLREKLVVGAVHALLRFWPGLRG
ncbi:MAG: sulfotransferase [Alphaproteobacteria bacterium]|nr:sulfotransferase [Alphaproteobacteria bacterium]